MFKYFCAFALAFAYSYAYAADTKASINASQAGTWTVIDGDGTNTISVKAASTQAAATDRSAVVQLNPNQPALTTPLNVNLTQLAGSASNITAKGTQAASALGTQDLKDSGRTAIMLDWERVAGTAAVESTLTNFTVGSKGGANITAATSYTVTTGKTLRIQSINLSLTSTSTVVNNARVRIRQAASGIANTSQIVWNYDIPWPIGGTVAANEGTSINIPIPDGLEIAATQQITVTWITAAATCTITAVITGYEY